MNERSGKISVFVCGAGLLRDGGAARPYSNFAPDRADHPPGTPAYNANAAKASWSTVLDFLK